MQFTFATFFALVLALAAIVLPAFSSPLAADVDIASLLHPPQIFNAPIAMNIPAAASRRREFELDNVMRKRIVNLRCSTPYPYTNGVRPADCDAVKPRPTGLFPWVSKVATRALMVGLH